MATTADYLNNLVAQKNTLADNLVAKGVSATHDELLDTLVPKVLEISGGGGDDPTYDYMPDMSGITGFFEPSGIDTVNNVWHNSIDGNDIELSNAVAEDNAVKFPVESFGTLPAPDEPEIIYIVYKRAGIGANPDEEVIIGKGMEGGTSGGAFDLYATPTFSIWGAPYVTPNVDVTQYHVITLVRYFDLNTYSQNFAMIYVDGILAGILSGAQKGNYIGNMCLNGVIRNGSLISKGTTDLYVKMVAIGSGQAVGSVVKNSEYLLKKYLQG